jgi:hypothetical protein
MAARLLQVVVFPYRGCSFTTMPQTNQDQSRIRTVSWGCAVYLLFPLPLDSVRSALLTGHGLGVGVQSDADR